MLIPTEVLAAAVDFSYHNRSGSYQQHGPYYPFCVSYPHRLCTVADLAVSKWSHRPCQLLNQTLLMPHLLRDSRYCWKAFPKTILLKIPFVLNRKRIHRSYVTPLRLVASLIVITFLMCTELLRFLNCVIVNSSSHLPSHLEDIINLAMEQAAASILFPRKYALTGCTKTFHYTVEAEHESVCEHWCPCPGTSCKWLIHPDQVMPHLLQCHKNIAAPQGNARKLSSWLKTSLRLGCAVMLWAILHANAGVAETSVSRPGFLRSCPPYQNQEQANQFMLYLTAPTRRLTWETTPWSIHDGAEVATAVYDCLISDPKTARHYCDHLSHAIRLVVMK
ncbi:E3 ubiquitin-protein ligase sina [Taenia solium]|eukprot:TsM_000341600 transcript=TsM_000341600 gene=TsM_000341600